MKKALSGLLPCIAILVLVAAPQAAALPESLDCAAIEGFYYDALANSCDVANFLKSSERYGISSSPWELTDNDVNAFQARLLQCKAQGQLTKRLPEHLLDRHMWIFKDFIAKSGQGIAQTAKRDEFLARITALENDMQSGAKAPAIVASEFKAIVDEIYDFRRKGENSYFSAQYSNTLISRAEAGLEQAQSADGAAKTTDIESLLVVLEKDATDTAHNINNLFERFGELSERAQVELASVSGSYQTKAADLQDRVNALGTRLISRLNSEILAYIKQEVQKIRTAMSGYTAKEHLASIATDYQKIDAIRNELRELTTNPETQNIIRINFEVESALGDLSGDLSRIKRNICTEVAREQCIASLPDFPEKYRDALVNGDGITILDVACAAQSRGFYKGFSAGGLFSSDIVLKLETGTLYFKEQRYSTETRQPVGSGYAGDTFTMLIATKMESDKGTQKIKNPSVEMYTFYMYLGGRPVAKECQE